MTTTDWRELCAELFAAYRTALYDDDLTLRARAALAQPEPEAVGPTDEELLELYPATMVDEEDAFAFARAVLARWGRPAPAPVTDDDMDLLVIAIQALRPKASPDSHDLAAVDRGTEIFRQWLTARGMA